MRGLSVAFVLALGLCVCAQADQLPIISVVCTGSWLNDPTGGGGYGCAGAIDGITTDFPSGQGVAGFWLGREQTPNETLTFDLGGIYSISSVDLYNTHNATNNDRGTLGFQMWISTTPVTPDTTSPSFGTPVLNKTLTFYPSTDPNPAQPFSFPPTVGRYVTFRALSYPPPSSPHFDGGAGLSEIVLHGAARCLTPPSGMVSWWPGDGNANDIVGVNNATLQGGATFLTGKVGQAFSLNSSQASYVDVPDALNLHLSSGDFTVTTWVNLTNPCITFSSGGCDQSIIDKMGEVAYVNDDGWRLLYQSDGHFWFCFGGGTGTNACFPGSADTVRSSTVASAGTWYHLAAVKSSGQISIS